MTCPVLFFFSSRRRHTRCSRDWSSDVCSSDLIGAGFRATARSDVTMASPAPACRSMRSEERRVGKSVDLGGRRIIKKKKKKKNITELVAERCVGRHGRVHV